MPSLSCPQREGQSLYLGLSCFTKDWGGESYVIELDFMLEQGKQTEYSSRVRSVLMRAAVEPIISDYAELDSTTTSELMGEIKQKIK